MVMREEKKIIFVLEREEMAGRYIKICEQLQNLYCTHNTVGTIELMIRWVGHISRKGK
jgi:hypothetical protein